MLQSFLNRSLHTAFRFTDFMREATHFPHIKPAADNEERYDQNNYTGQCPVHQKQEYKRTYKFQEGIRQSRNAFCKKRNDICNIPLHAVKEITGMKTSQPFPPARKQTAQKFLAHIILSFNPQHGFDPPRGYPQQYLQHYNTDKQRNGRMQGHGCIHTCSNVNRHFRCPNKSQVRQNGKATYQHIKKSLHTITFPYSP